MDKPIQINLEALAYAIGTRSKTIQNWLAREQIGSFQKKGHRELSFDLMDVATLSITRKLVDFGMRVQIANRHTVESVAELLIQSRYDINDYGISEINTQLIGRRLLIYNDSVSRLIWRSKVTTVSDLDLPADVVIIVSIDRVVALALKRLIIYLGGEAYK